MPKIVDPELAHQLDDTKEFCEECGLFVEYHTEYPECAAMEDDDEDDEEEDAGVAEEEGTLR